MRDRRRLPGFIAVHDDAAGTDEDAVRAAVRAARTPEIWIETGAGLPVDAAADFWSTPGVYQFARSDARQRRNPGSGTEIYDPTQSPESWGESLYIIHALQHAQWAAQWAAVGKPFRVVPLIVGPDDAAGDSPLRLNTNPLDYVNGGQRSYFRANGIALVTPWMTTAAETYLNMLQGDSLDPAAVVAMVDDLEAFDAMDFDDVSMADNLADARANSEPVSLSGKAMVDWLDGKDTDLNGDSLPPWNPAYNKFHPEQWEGIRQADELEKCVIAYCQHRAIAEPFQQMFPGIRYGSWGMFNASRARPAFWRQTQYRYLMDGDFAFGYSCPNNYRGIPANPWRSEASVDADPRWETVNRTSAAFGISPPDQDAAAAAGHIELARSIGRIADHRLFPSMTVDNLPGTLGDATYTAARDHLVRWLVEAGNNGADRFWLHAPAYNTSAVERARVADLVAAFRAAWVVG